MRINLSFDRDKVRKEHIDFLKKRSKILDDDESDTIRQKFIDNFIDTSSKNYKEIIEQQIRNKKGKFYSRYLWDTLKVYKRVQKKGDLDFLDDLMESDVYVMSDLHTKERLGNSDVLLPFFQVNKIITGKLKDVLRSLASLSQDTYIFDASFKWYLVLTHERDAIGHEIYYQESLDKLANRGRVRKGQTAA